MQFLNPPVNHKNLAECASRGWLVGPCENEIQFLKRIESFQTTSPFSSKRFQDIFGIAPNWIEVIYTNKLTPWQGGMVTIEKDHVILEVRKAFQKQKRFLGYSSEEIISHECVHMTRMEFDEPIFEEVLAYQTSFSRFRRYWGPFFRTPRESTLWLFSLLTFTFLTFFFNSGLLVIALFGIICGYGAIRLKRTQHIFYRCLNHLSKFAGNETKARQILLCLTDKEIQEFGKASEKMCRECFLAKKGTSLRWLQIEAICDFL